MFLVSLAVAHFICSLRGLAFGTDDKTVEQALDYVFQLQASNCGDLVIGDVLPLQFDVTAWDQYADPAIRTANLLTEIIVSNNGTLDSLSDEMFFLMVRNNVHGNSLIFGAALAFERGVFSKYELFAPYAYKSNNTVRSHDLSINYFYLDPDREWYNSVKVKDKSNITMARDGVQYRENNSLLPEQEEIYPVASLADGHWTNPYYDCGGGEIWMVTYSAPILNLKDGKPVFQGVATIDIELTYIDINQCDSDESLSTSGLDVFRGTHKCQPTTTCVPEKGMGFVPGAYKCVCKDGYFFPRVHSEVRAYTGVEIENWTRNSNDSLGVGMFRCSKCAAGCDTCVDDSPCLHQRSNAVVISLLIFNLLTVAGIIGIAVSTYLYRHEMVMKSASPIFLELMCLGGVLICTQFFMHYPTASITTCSIRIWPQNIGFFVMYGSLVLKTWRISMIFSVGTHKRVRLPDRVLLQRLGLLLLLVIAVLSAWTTSQPPKIETLKTKGDLKFYICDFGPWQYALQGGEILFLLYGVYLCFTVRKAPAHFNESKHITWAVYNAIILGSFMSFMSRLFISVIGPDYMLVFQFAQIQVYATFTLLIIFGPKAWAIKKKIEIEPVNPALTTHNTVQTITGRVKNNQVAALPTIIKAHAATQTN